jgi:L-threonylcarbamoyladenylate synthase
LKRVPFVTADDVARSTPQIVEHLRAGGLIAYPTETVYGFGGLIRDDALTALAALKSRDDTKPFLVLIREPSDVPAIEWTPQARKLANAFWPGPLTIALRVQADFPARIISDEGTIAVRATPHAGVRALLESLGEPITSSSANTPRNPPATSTDEVVDVLETLGQTDVLVLDGGALMPSSPSTLVDCSVSPPRVLRAGAITIEALTQVVDIE